MQSIEELKKRKEKADKLPEAVRAKFQSTYDQIKTDLTVQIMDKANEAHKFAEAVMKCIEESRWEDMIVEYDRFREAFSRQI